MKIIFSLILILITSCQSELEKDLDAKKVTEPFQITIGDYRLIGENLFEDKNGNVYFRIIDKSAINDEMEVFATYSNKVRYDTLINDSKTYIVKELKHVVDLYSFKEIRKDGLTTYFQDNNHEYFHRETADGGILHCTK